MYCLNEQEAKKNIDFIKSTLYNTNDDKLRLIIKMNLKEVVNFIKAYEEEYIKPIILIPRILEKEKKCLK